MLSNLFSSKVLFEVMHYLFQKENYSATVSEIVKNTNNNQVSVSRSLDKLVKWDFAQKVKKGSSAYVYTLSKKNAYCSYLKDLFTMCTSDGKKFFKVNEESGVSILGWSYFIAGFSSPLVIRYKLLPEVKTSFAFIKNGYGEYFMHKESFLKNSEVSLRKLKQNQSFVHNTIYLKTIAAGKDALGVARIIERDLDILTPQQAVDFIDKFSRIITQQIALGHIAVFDMIDQSYSNYLKKYIDNKTKGSDLRSSIVMEKLLSPGYISHTQSMRLDLINLAFKKKMYKKNNKSHLEEIWRKWKWINYGYKGPSFALSYFKQTLQELENKSSSELEVERKAIVNYRKNIIKQKKHLYAQLNIDTVHKNFIEALSVLSYLKVYRKDTAFLLIYLTYKLIAKFNTSLSLKQVHLLTVSEAKKLILGKLAITKTQINQREEGVVLYESGTKILDQNDALQFIESNVIPEKQTTEHTLRQLEGVTASLGETGNWIYGTAKIINTSKDMRKMEEGDILISFATTPDILPAMKKASAIITDQGGITCHAAIVSRELNIPCLIATKYATKVFKDGDKIVMCPRHSYVKFQ